MIIPPCLTSCSQQLNYTLEPLVTLGADALAPAPVHGIKRVFLQELAIGWDNVFQEIVVRRASDVFACTAAAGRPYDMLPPGAHLVWAVLRFNLAGYAALCLVEIRPPRIFILCPVSAVGIIEAWLATRGFAAAAQRN